MTALLPKGEVAEAEPKEGLSRPRQSAAEEPIAPASTRDFRALFRLHAVGVEHSRDIILFIRMDGRILEANAAATAMYGYNRDEFLRLSIRDLRPPEDAHLVATQMADACAHGILFEAVHCRKDGSRFPVEVSAQGASLGDERFVISVVRDITERRQREKELEAVFEGTDAQLALLDREFRFLRVNVSYALGAGRSRADLLGKNHFELFPDGKIRRIFERVRDTGEPYQAVEAPFELSKPYDDGTRYRNWSLAAIKDGSGAVTGVLLSVLDVTDQVRTRRRAEQLATRLETLLAITEEMSASLEIEQVVGLVLDRGGRLLGAKAANLSIRTGTDRLEPLTVVKGNANEPEPDRRLPIDEKTPEGLAACKRHPVWLETFAEIESRFPSIAPIAQKDGIVSIACVPLIAHDDLVGVMAFAFDGARRFSKEDRLLILALGRHTTEALQRVRWFEAERIARERMEQLHAVTAACSAALTPSDVARSIFDQALSRLGCSAIEICRVVDPDHWRLEYTHGGPTAAAARSALFSVHAPLPAAECIRTRTPIWTETRDEACERPPSLVEMHQAPGDATASLPLIVEERVLGVLVLTFAHPCRFTPETRAFFGSLASACALALARAWAYEQVREESRRKDHFLAMLSHELRNPLTPIRNSMYVLHRAPAGSEQARRALCIIDRQSAHLTRLIDDLLEQTRIARGKIALQRGPMELTGLVRRIGEDHRASFERSGIDFDVCMNNDEELWVEGDSARLMQAIGNLLQNAAKFTPRGGAATLALERTGQLARITVRDTGAGISQELLPRLFQPFVQADMGLDRSSGGLGLGLSIAKSLIELHGGRVFVTSDGPGSGAEFVLLLPVIDAVAAPRSSHERPVGTSRRVLIVEDVVDAAQSLREILELSGHVVDVAHTGKQGVEKARRSRPDVVLCDIGLPGMDGYEVARAIRRDPALAATYLVALTGYALADERRRLAEAGFDLHLTKPPDTETVTRLIATRPKR